MNFILFVLSVLANISSEKADWTYKRDVFGTTGWYFEEGAFLEMVYHENDLWREIEPFLRKFDIEEELFRYQKAIVRMPEVKEVTVCSEYNFYPYFAALDENIPAELKKIKSTLNVRLRKDVSTWSDYAREIIWFGKRYNATLIVNPREIITYSEG